MADQDPQQQLDKLLTGSPGSLKDSQLVPLISQTDWWKKNYASKYPNATPKQIRATFFKVSGVPQGVSIMEDMPASPYKITSAEPPSMIQRGLQKVSDIWSSKPVQDDYNQVKEMARTPMSGVVTAAMPFLPPTVAAPLSKFLGGKAQQAIDWTNKRLKEEPAPATGTAGKTDQTLLRGLEHVTGHADKVLAGIGMGLAQRGLDMTSMQNLAPLAAFEVAGPVAAGMEYIKPAATAVGAGARALGNAGIFATKYGTKLGGWIAGKVFSAEMLSDAYKSIPGVKEAIDNKDYVKAGNLIGSSVADVAMATAAESKDIKRVKEAAVGTPESREISRRIRDAKEAIGKSEPPPAAKDSKLEEKRKQMIELEREAAKKTGKPYPPPLPEAEGESPKETKIEEPDLVEEEEKPEPVKKGKKVEIAKPSGVTTTSERFKEQEKPPEEKAKPAEKVKPVAPTPEAQKQDPASAEKGLQVKIKQDATTGSAVGKVDLKGGKQIKPVTPKIASKAPESDMLPKELLDIAKPIPHQRGKFHPDKEATYVAAVDWGPFKQGQLFKNVQISDSGMGHAEGLTPAGGKSKGGKAITFNPKDFADNNLIAPDTQDLVEANSKKATATAPTSAPKPAAAKGKGPMKNGVYKDAEGNTLRFAYEQGGKYFFRGPSGGAAVEHEMTGLTPFDEATKAHHGIAPISRVRDIPKTEPTPGEKPKTAFQQLMEEKAGPKDTVPEPYTNEEAGEQEGDLGKKLQEAIKKKAETEAPPTSLEKDKWYVDEDGQEIRFLGKSGNKLLFRDRAGSTVTRAQPEAEAMEDLRPFESRPSGMEMARTEGGRVKLGADVRSLGEVLGSSLYEGDAQLIIPKELAQNAFDAIRGVPNGKVIMRVDGNNSTVEMEDNGKGMTREELETVFTDLGASGKRGASEASGGFGIAKAAPLLRGEKIEVETVSDEPGGRFRHSFTSTPEELMGQGVEIKTEKVKEGTPTGTKIISHLPKGKGTWRATEYAKQLSRSSNLPGKFEFHEMKSEWDRDFKKETKQWEQSKLEPSVTKRVAQEEIPGVAKVELHASSEKQDIPVPTVEARVHNNGIYQFTKSIYMPGDKKAFGIPSVVNVDVKPTVREGNPEYPFTANREAIRGSILEKVEEMIKEHIVRPGVKKFSEKMKEAFRSMPTVAGMPSLDAGGRFTKEELKSLEDNASFKALADEIGKQVSATIEKLKGATGDLAKKVGDMKTDWGLVFSDAVHGLNMKHPQEEGSSDKAHRVLINPFSFLDEKTTPGEAASAVWHAIKHELLHNEVGGHYQTFTTGELDLGKAIGGDHEIEALLGLRDVYAEPGKPGEINSGIREALRVYRESRTRPERTPDILGGEEISTKGREPEPAGEKGNPVPVQTSREEAPGKGEPPEVKPQAGPENKGEVKAQAAAESAIYEVTPEVRSKYPAFSSFADTLLSGEVYHGTTERQAAGIIDKGFKPLNVSDEISRAMHELGVDFSSLTNSKRKAITEMASSYRSQAGSVSVTPHRKVAERWSGTGGEIAKAVEGIIKGREQGKWRSDLSLLSGKPAVIKGKLDPYPERSRRVLQRELKYAQELVENGDFTEQQVIDMLQEDYFDIRANPSNLKDLQISAAVDGANYPGLKDKESAKDKLREGEAPVLASKIKNLMDKEHPPEKTTVFSTEPTYPKNWGPKALAAFADWRIRHTPRGPVVYTNKAAQMILDKTLFSNAQGKASTGLSAQADSLIKGWNNSKDKKSGDVIDKLYGEMIRAAWGEAGKYSEGSTPSKGRVAIVRAERGRPLSSIKNTNWHEFTHNLFASKQARVAYGLPGSDFTGDRDAIVAISELSRRGYKLTDSRDWTDEVLAHLSGGDKLGLSNNQARNLLKKAILHLDEHGGEDVERITKQLQKSFRKWGGETRREGDYRLFKEPTGSSAYNRPQRSAPGGSTGADIPPTEKVP